LCSRSWCCSDPCAEQFTSSPVTRCDTRETHPRYVHSVGDVTAEGGGRSPDRGSAAQTRQQRTHEQSPRLLRPTTPSAVTRSGHQSAPQQVDRALARFLKPSAGLEPAVPYHGGPAIAATPLQSDKAAAQRGIERSRQAVATGTFRHLRCPRGTRRAVTGSVFRSGAGTFSRPAHDKAEMHGHARVEAVCVSGLIGASRGLCPCPSHAFRKGLRGAEPGPAERQHHLADCSRLHFLRRCRDAPRT
jgi:hypothetical protein